MTDKDLNEVADAVFFKSENSTEETEEVKPVIVLSNKGIAKLIVTALASDGISKATTSAMKTFGYAPELYGKKGKASILTKVQISVASMYVSRIIIEKTSKMIDSDLDKIADIIVEIRDSLGNKETE